MHLEVCILLKGIFLLRKENVVQLFGLSVKFVVILRYLRQSYIFFVQSLFFKILKDADSDRLKIWKTISHLTTEQK